ncbi:RtcB family protein, partial [bacterium]|nr:RtcB family protein [bacterium]
MTRQTHSTFDSSPNGELPIRLFTDGELMPDQSSQVALQRLAAVPGLKHYVAVLPDVHYKPRNPSPTGTVVASHNVLIPRAIDGGVNCGIRMMSAPVPANSFSSSRLDELFQHLIQAIPYKKREQSLLSHQACEKILLHGANQVIDELDLPSDEITRVENGGRMLPHLEPEMIREGLAAGDVLQTAIRKGNRSLGTIGGGNHFLELQEIVEVFDERAARLLGLEVGHSMFMLHCDSRRLGKKLLKPILEEAEASYGANGAGELWTVPVESEIGHRYLCGLAAAGHAGFANRAAVTQILRQTLWQVLGDSSIPLSLIYDCSHEAIQREKQNGDWLWVHRHGASHAMPSSSFAHDAVLAQTGQPVPIPGSMGTESYMAVALPGVTETFHSVAHGAGRVIEKDVAAEQFAIDEVTDVLQGQGIRLYRYGLDNIAGQAPVSFKSA